MTESRPLGRFGDSLRDPSPARDWLLDPPPGWDRDLWGQFKFGAIYEDEVPRDPDGEPLYDGDGNLTRAGRRYGW